MLRVLLAWAVLVGAPALAQEVTVVPRATIVGPKPIDARCRYTDPTEIPRDARGDIARSTAARAAFVRVHPCPSTGEVTGACPGWSVDHVIPLAVGGADDPINMQWLPQTIKACAARPDMQCKDRFERRIYRCRP